MQNFNRKTAFLIENISFLIENLQNSNPELQLSCRLSRVRSPQLSIAGSPSTIFLQFLLNSAISCSNHPSREKNSITSSKGAMGPGIDRLIKTASYQVINAWPHGPLDLAKLIDVVAKVLKIKEDDVCTGDKQTHHVRARSLLCYWAVRELGMTATALAKTLEISQPAVTQCVRRGEKIATDNGWHLPELLGE